MSIEFSLKINDNIVNEKLLMNEINRFGVKVDVKFDNEDIFEIDSTYELLGFYTTLIKKTKPPYNVYETRCLKNDFEYNQVILFGFNKEGDLNSAYSNALEIIFNLMKGINSSAILTSSVHDEICYFENSTSVHVNRTVELLEKINYIIDKDKRWKCLYY